MKIEIAPHFRKSIAEINTDIEQLSRDRERLVATRDTLLELYGGDTPLEAIKKPERRPRQPRRAASAPAASSGPANGAPTTNGEEKAGRWSGEGITMLAHIRKMPEPISGTTLAVAAGVDRVKAGNYISRFAAKGWLKKTGYGEYIRTADLPEQL